MVHGHGGSLMPPVKLVLVTVLLFLLVFPGVAQAPVRSRESRIELAPGSSAEWNGQSGVAIAETRSVRQ